MSAPAQAYTEGDWDWPSGYRRRAAELIDFAERAGSPVDQASLHFGGTQRVMLTAAVARGFAARSMTDPSTRATMGFVAFDGLEPGDTLASGIYRVDAVADGAKPVAVLSDAQGREVWRGDLEVERVEPPPSALKSFCSSFYTFAPNGSCVGFVCCAPITGCISNKVCLKLNTQTIDP